MKKMLCLLLVFALVGALYACGVEEAPVETQATDPTVSASPTETEQTEPPVEPEEPTDGTYDASHIELPQKQKAVLHTSMIDGNLYCGSDPYRCGFLTFTNLYTGETVSGMSGYSFWRPLDTDELDWENAVSDPGDLFADSMFVVRLENVDNGWYAEFHDGSNAQYIYYSSEDLYIPIKPRDGRSGDVVSQEISAEIAQLYGELVWMDVFFRIDNTTPEEVARMYVARKAEMVSLSTGVEFTATYAEVLSVSEDGGKIELYYELTGNSMATFANYEANADGSYTGKMTDKLVLDENGQWISARIAEYLSYGG